MEYRAVGNRLAVNFESLRFQVDLPTFIYSENTALMMLEKKGFKVLEIDIIALARKCINTSQYRRCAKSSEAPAVVDCSSFIKWLYGQSGIWLPRRSIQQRDMGEIVAFDDIRRSDVVFISGRVDYFHDDPCDGVGHVGIATGTGTVIHAANSKIGVIETPLSEFVDKKFRGARRYLPKNVRVFVLQIPPNREVEIEDDLRWIISQPTP